ncbi:MAG: hypothetical protein JZU50_02430 [Desulfobulbaceae bacterium]|nr:hypothetical protein [Desulfobulbaceae bacterium]
MTMGLPYRPLGLVKEMLEPIGIEVAYAYEDLIFMEHNDFLLQFGKQGERLFFSANVETTDADGQRLFALIQSVASGQGFTLTQRGQYRVSIGAEENLTLVFLDDAAASA